MDMNPVLTTTVYIILVAVAIATVTYMIVYTRGLHAKKSVMDSKGRPPISREEGISVATLERERKAHAGKFSWN